MPIFSASAGRADLDYGELSGHDFIINGSLTSRIECVDAGRSRLADRTVA